MVTLIEALELERAKQRRAAQDGSTRAEVSHVILRALAESLSGTPDLSWQFQLRDDGIDIVSPGQSEVVGRWTLDDEFRLQLGETVTEWITSESYHRVIEQAVRLTACLILDAEEREGAIRRAGIRALPVPGR